MTRKLNKRQRDFCRYYAESENVRLSAKKAGYAPSMVPGFYYKIEKEEFVNCIQEYKKKLYSLEQYMIDLNKAQKLAEDAKDIVLLLKIIDAKASTYGINRTAAEEKKPVVKKKEYDFFDKQKDLMNKKNGLK